MILFFRTLWLATTLHTDVNHFLSADLLWWKAFQLRHRCRNQPGLIPYTNPAMSSPVDDRTPTHQGTNVSTDEPREQAESAFEAGSDHMSSSQTEKQQNDEETTDLDALLDEFDDDEDPQDEPTVQNDPLPGGSKTAPEEMLQTNHYEGLTDAEVHDRRRLYGFNEMKEEKENLIIKFLMFFVGPIQFVMEVSQLINLQ